MTDKKIDNCKVEVFKIGEEPVDEIQNVSVYGTLRNGERAFRMLEGCSLVKEGITSMKMKMVNCGAFPALVQDKDDHQVYLETYKVSGINVKRALDQYEGYPMLYSKAILTFADGTKSVVYYMRDISREYPEIKSGDWKNR